jgi:hypothetical protein
VTDQPTTAATKAERFTPDETIARQRNRQLMIVSVIIVALAGLIALSRTTRSFESPLAEVLLVGGTADAPNFKPENVTRLEIYRGADDPLVIVRQPDGWRLPARKNAPANKESVDSLVSRVCGASRLNRPSSTNISNYDEFGLDDKDAVHLKLIGEDGKPLLHILVGRTEVGSREFVRVLGENAPEGIFQLTQLGGTYDSIYMALNLDASGDPGARRWVSTDAFKPLPAEAIVHEFTLRDGTRSLTFSRTTVDGDSGWRLTAPHDAEAEAQVIQGVLDALTYSSAVDVAGRDTDATELKVAMPEREVRMRYTLNGEPGTRQVYYGESNDRREVAVWVKAINEGEFIYWAGNHVLTRVFRPKADFLKKSRVTPVPDGVDVVHILTNDNGVLTELEREKVGAVVNWKLRMPLQADADRVEVANLLTQLNTLTGYRVDGDFDREALSAGPGLSTRVLTVKFPPLSDSDRDGDDGVDDTLDAETPEPPKPEVPKLRTATLYFGKPQHGEVPVVRELDGTQVLYWIPVATADRFFRAPAEYARAAALNIVRDGLNIEEIQITKAGILTHLLKEPTPGGRKEWQLKSPSEERADAPEVNMLLSELGMLQGVAEAGLDKSALKLGPGLSERSLVLRLQRDETAAAAALYFGELRHGLVSVLMIHGGAETFHLVKPAFVGALFEHVFKDYEVRVRHILVSWAGKMEPERLKHPSRTEAQARAMAQQILERAQGGEDFIELQKQFNEDGDATAVYDVNPSAGLVRPFKRLSSELEVGGVGIVETQFGLHIIKRIE